MYKDYLIGGIADNKSGLRNANIITKELAVVATHTKNWKTIFQGESSEYNAVSATYFEGSDRSRYVESSETIDINGNAADVYHIIDTSGTASSPANFDHIVYATHATKHWYGSISEYEVVKGGVDITYWTGWKTDDATTVRADEYVVDWGATLEPLYDSENGDYIDPESFTIVGWKWGTVTQEDTAKMSPETPYYENSNAKIIGSMINNLNIAYHSSGVNGATQNFDGSALGLNYKWDTETTYLTVLSTDQNCPSAIEVDGGYYITFPGTITVYLLNNIYIDNGFGETTAYGTVNSGNTDELEAQDSDYPSPDNSKITTDVDSGSGSKVLISGKGSNDLDQVNNTRLHYDDYITSFDSAYLSAGVYSQFVSAGGGVIAQSGAWANSEGLYVESIDLSVSGSSMILVQLESYDSSAKMETGERIYGYLVNEDGDKNSQFAGIVHSISRRMGERGQEIVYECRDLKNYLNNLYTPVLYVNSDVDIKSLTNELLIKSGITNFVNNLPDTVRVSVSYQSSPITQVLDFVCSLAGEYFYWVDKSGYLIIDKLDNTNHSYNIPSVGDAVSTNKVLDYKSLEDTSNSRSRIIVIGGNGGKVKEGYIYKTFKETDWTKNYDSLNDAINALASGFVTVGTTHPNVLQLYYLYKVVNKEALSSLPTLGKSPFIEEYDSNQILNSYGTHKIVASISDFYLDGESTLETRNFYKNGNHYGYFITKAFKVFVNNNALFSFGDTKAIKLYYAYRDLTDIFRVIYDTGNYGGVEVYTDSNFRKIDGINENIDDTDLMQVIAANLANYYTTAYGGTLELDGLETDIELGDTITLTNTNLPANARNSLKVFSISYNNMDRKTTIQLSNRLSSSGLSLDASVLRNNLEYYKNQYSINSKSILRKLSSF